MEGDAVGLDNGEVSEVICLGRTVRTTPSGLEIEADKRLAIKVVDEANLVGGKGVDNPGGAVKSKGGGGGCTGCEGVDLRSPKRSDYKLISTGQRRLILCK